MLGNGINIKNLRDISQYLLTLNYVPKTVEGADSRSYKKQKFEATDGRRNTVILLTEVNTNNY